MMSGDHVVLGISGASGMPIAVRTASALSEHFDVHTVVTDAARTVMGKETGDREATLHRLESVSRDVYGESELGAPIASGSVPTAGMAVVPASM
ncbi:MAG: flavoprotein, partial [Halodesulfurarchaeum sp.]